MSEITTATPSPIERDAAVTVRNPCNGQFQKGNRSSVGHGRPRGSRALLTDVFLTDVYEAWQRDGASTLKRVAEEEPGTFLKVVASIMPKQIDAEISLFADAGSFAEAFQLAVETIGGNTGQAMKRLRRVNPRLVEIEGKIER